MHRIQIAAQIVFAIVALNSLVAVAQTEEAPEQKRKSLEVEEPQRQIRFDVIEEPFQKRLLRADPKLLEQKFVAEIRLSFTYTRDGARDMASVPNFMGAVQFLPNEQRVIPTGQWPNPGLTWKGFQDYFAAVLVNVPEEKRPPENVMEVFLRRADEGYVWNELEMIDARSRDERAERGFLHTFYVLADSADRAQRSAEAFLTLFDYGVILPAQARVLKDRDDAEQELGVVRQQSVDQRKVIAKLKDQLASTPSIGPEALSEFGIRQHLSNVDLAGIRARIDTINRLLKLWSERNALKTARVEQLEDLKIAAEVELAGVAARQKALSQLIVSGENRSRLNSELLSANQENANNIRQERTLESRISRLERVFDVLSPLPLHEGKITIRPVEWQPGE